MTLQQLIYIVEIEKTRSFTWAADNLFMSQPNLSRSIRELEKNLGFEIFQRTSRGMIPTLEGSELIERAKRIIFQLESIDEIGRRKQHKRQTFGLSVPHLSYIAMALGRLMSGFDPEWAIDIDYCETDTMQAIENLREQRHNLAIVRFKSSLEAEALQLFEDHSLLADTICESEALILISRKHPLAGYECIDYEALDEYIELKYRDNDIAGHSAGAFGITDKSRAPKQAIIYSHGSQFDLLSGSNSTFMWATRLPREVLLREKLVMRPCSRPGDQYKDMILWRSSYKFSSLDEKFITYLREIINSTYL